MIISTEYKDRVHELDNLIDQYEPTSVLVQSARTNKFLREETDGHGILGAAKRVRKMGFHAAIHSAEMELPSHQPHNKLLSSPERISMRKELSRCRRNIRNAWQYALEHYEEPTEAMIKAVAAKVDSEHFPLDEAPYRIDNVRILGGKYIPPRAEKVQREMTQLIVDVNELDDSLEQAVMLHFGIVRIHPFEDTNGRTSRIIQNSHLVTYGLPPAIVHRGERLFYNRLVEDAVGGHRMRHAEEREGISPEEQRLYNFLATKVIISLEKIIDTTTKKKK